MPAPTLSHDEVSRRLAAAGVEFGAAEVHGLASGLLSTNEDRTDALLVEVLPDVADGDLLAAECQTMLRHLSQDTRDALQDSAFRFSPLLPEDDSSDLRQRVGALRDWCEGFLYGFGLSEAHAEKLPPGVTEAIGHIAELTRVDPASVTDSEEEEQAFAELVEFARVAVMLIREELAGSSGDQP